jgi:hypothetical protein
MTQEKLDLANELRNEINKIESITNDTDKIGSIEIRMHEPGKLLASNTFYGSEIRKEILSLLTRRRAKLQKEFDRL